MAEKLLVELGLIFVSLLPPGEAPKLLGTVPALARLYGLSPTAAFVRSARTFCSGDVFELLISSVTFTLVGVEVDLMVDGNQADDTPPSSRISRALSRLVASLVVCILDLYLLGNKR